MSEWMTLNLEAVIVCVDPLCPGQIWVHGCFDPHTLRSGKVADKKRFFYRSHGFMLFDEESGPHERPYESAILEGWLRVDERTLIFKPHAGVEKRYDLPEWGHFILRRDGEFVRVDEWDLLCAGGLPAECFFRVKSLSDVELPNVSARSENGKVVGCSARADSPHLDLVVATEDADLDDLASLLNAFHGNARQHSQTFDAQSAMVNFDRNRAEAWVLDTFELPAPDDKVPEPPSSTLPGYSVALKHKGSGVVFNVILIEDGRIIWNFPEGDWKKLYTLLERRGTAILDSFLGDEHRAAIALFEAGVDAVVQHVVEVTSLTLLDPVPEEIGNPWVYSPSLIRKATLFELALSLTDGWDKFDEIRAASLRWGETDGKTTVWRKAIRRALRPSNLLRLAPIHMQKGEMAVKDGDLVVTSVGQTQLFVPAGRFAEIPLELLQSPDGAGEGNDDVVVSYLYGQGLSDVFFQGKTAYAHLAREGRSLVLAHVSKANGSEEWLQTFEFSPDGLSSTRGCPEWLEPLHFDKTWGVVARLTV